MYLTPVAAASREQELASHKGAASTARTVRGVSLNCCHPEVQIGNDPQPRGAAETDDCRLLAACDGIRHGRQRCYVDAVLGLALQVGWSHAAQPVTLDICLGAAACCWWQRAAAAV